MSMQKKNATAKQPKMGPKNKVGKEPKKIKIAHSNICMVCKD